MKIAIVGDGIAARTLLAMMLKQIRSSEENVWHAALPSVHLIRSNLPLMPSLFTGLWSASINHLINDIGISAETISSSSCAVRESGYRDKNGRWLMKPKVGLRAYPDRPSLHFFENQKLLEMIITQNSQSAKNTVSITESNNTTIQQVVHNQESTVLITSDGEEIEANIVIVADGMNSRMKEIIHRQSVDFFLCHRGYQVFRGVCSAAGLKGLDPSIAFQSWGPSARFAVVPVNDYQEIAWFAAVSAPRQQASKYFSSCASSATLPFSNGAAIATAEEMARLRKTFVTWHNPIPAILGKTISGGTIVVNEAFSSTNPSQNTSYVDPTSKSAFIFVGDANFTLDPILAQGAGVAIEESVLVVNTISKILEDPTSLVGSIQDFERKRSLTIQKLHQVSNLAQIIGHQDSPFRNHLRDNFLTVIPSSMKERIFDHFIHYVDDR